MARVVVDASVLVSAPFGGDSAAALVEILEGHHVILSDAIVHELKVLTERVEEKIGKARARRFSHLVRDIVRKGNKVRVRRKISLCRDRSDDKYLDAAIAGRATLIVTRDRDLLSITSSEKQTVGLGRLEILSPSAFLRRFILQ